MVDMFLIAVVSFIGKIAEMGAGFLSAGNTGRIVEIEQLRFYNNAWFNIGGANKLIIISPSLLVN